MRWSRLNALVDGLISQGRYEEALRAADGLVVGGDGAGEEDARALVRINQAEALYNLGQWDDAARLLEAARAEAPGGLPGAAWLIQRAWVAAHAGDVATARRCLADVRADEVPPLYHAELCFTHAVTELADGRLEAAMRAAREGEEAAVRPSSVRNATFLRALIAWRMGRLVEAERLFARGADHPYQGQGGAALLAWGDLLVELGRPEQARHAWALVLTRDPESEAAEIAAFRLADFVAV